MPNKPKVPALDESWTSLDVADFSQDEDCRSENIGNESLVDLSSAHDTESMVSDEGEDNRAQHTTVDDSVMTTKLSTSKETEISSPIGKDLDEGDEDSILLARSETQTDPDSVHVEYLLQPTYDVVDGNNIVTRESISMNISTESMRMGDEAFKIAYYGRASGQKSKDELLGKIGAALIADQTPPTSTSSSNCFNIVPTEFGNGSKPTFADLIPSQARMEVDQLTTSESRKGHAEFSLQDGRTFPTTRTWLGRLRGTWRPDLAVVHISEDDVAEDFKQADSVVALAVNHNWPVLIVAQSNVWHMVSGFSDLAITRNKYTDNGDTTEVEQWPIDLESFLTIDSTQLNQALRLLADKAQATSSTTVITRQLVKSLISIFKAQSSPRLSLKSEKAQHTIYEMPQYNARAREMVKQAKDTARQTQVRARSFATRTIDGQNLGMFGMTLGFLFTAFILISTFSSFPSPASGYRAVSRFNPQGASMATATAVFPSSIPAIVTQFTAQVEVEAGRIDNDAVIAQANVFEYLWNVIPKPTVSSMSTARSFPSPVKEPGQAHDAMKNDEKQQQQQQHKSDKLSPKVTRQQLIDIFGTMSSKMRDSTKKALHQMAIRPCQRNEQRRAGPSPGQKPSLKKIIGTAYANVQRLLEPQTSIHDSVYAWQRNQLDRFQAWAGKTFLNGPKKRLLAAQSQAVKAYEIPQRKKWFGRKKD